MLAQALLQEEGGRYLTGNLIVERGLEWIRRQDGPFFTWLHFMDIHYPYHPLPGQRRWIDRARYLMGMAGMLGRAPNRANLELRRLYDRRVELLDGLIGTLLDGLRRLDLNGETIVVLTSDHGERFGERGEYGHGPDMYDDLLHVPLLIRAPRHFAPRRVEAQFALIDLAPTLIQLLGIAIPSSYQGQGRLSVLEGGATGRGEPAFAEAMHGGGRRSRMGTSDSYRILACRSSGWKYIRDEEGPIEELYHLERDPAETENVADRRRDVLDSLRSETDAHLRYVERTAEGLQWERERGVTSGDEEVRRRLAELGYL
jgi:arylsulfatase A-like enzyme